MVQRRNDAASKDAQINPPKEECALSMVQRRNRAAMKDVQIKLSKEECAGGMGRRRSSNDVAVRSAPI